MCVNLKEQVAIVTGGSRGIGAAICIELARAGARVIAASRNVDRMRSWITEHADVADLIAPYPAAAMTVYPVSPRVNSVRHDDASLLEHVDPAAGEAAGDHEPPPHPPEQESLF